jgi:hypothetical protein
VNYGKDEKRKGRKPLLMVVEPITFTWTERALGNLTMIRSGVQSQEKG